MASKDFTGLRGGRLVAESRTDKKTKSRSWIWKFRCDCGGSTEARVADVRNGHTTSCGCYHKERTREAKTIHGMEGTKLYRIWSNMKTRCSNSNVVAYKNYGGRGIIVCNEWLEFNEFYKWAKKSGYKDNLTIERTDVNGNYEPLNCEWIPLSEQNSNKRNTRVFEIDGRSYTAKELSLLSGVSYGILRNRRYRGENILTKTQYNEVCNSLEAIAKKPKQVANPKQEVKTTPEQVDAAIGDDVPF